MNEKQKKIIDKLNKDNKNLSEAHKTWVEYSKGRILLGIVFIIILVIIIFIN